MLRIPISLVELQLIEKWLTRISSSLRQFRNNHTISKVLYIESYQKYYQNLCLNTLDRKSNLRYISYFRLLPIDNFLKYNFNIFILH